MFYALIRLINLGERRQEIKAPACANKDSKERQRSDGKNSESDEQEEARFCLYHDEMETVIIVMREGN